MATQLAGVLRHLHRLVKSPDGPEWSDERLLHRFLADRDESAFRLLVERHGRMVLSVCRHVLRQQQDAEDAFQATFLVLAQSASSIRKGTALASWLYGVAYRTSLKVRAETNKRQLHERKACERARTKAELDVAVRELQAILADEVNRLPEKYRAPFVLCCLEGKSRTEAAGQLGWKEGTVSSRLAEARKRLRRRLLRRGVTLAAALCIESLAEATVAVPTSLAQQTIVSAAGIASGRTAASVAPGTVAALATGMTRTLYLGKVKFAAILLVVLGVTAAGAGVLVQQTPETSEGPVESTKAVAHNRKLEPVVVKPTTTEHKDDVAYSGRVLGPDGRPVSGAKLYLTPWFGYLHEPDPSPVFATTGADGRFRFSASKAKFDTRTVVAAAAANYGPDWVGIEKDGKRDDLTLRLVPDDGQIVGQIVNLEGRPIAGATFTVMQINAAPKEDLGPWLEAVKAREGLSLAIEQKYLSRMTVALCPKVTTDAEGRLRLGGIGRNRLVRGQLDGPTIASQRVCILTRPGRPFDVMEDEGNREYHEPHRVTTYYGSNFRLVAAPCQPIVGVVRDKDTKKPLAGVAVRSYAQATGPSSFRDVEAVVRTTTDAQGRYRLTGLPKGDGYTIAALPGGGLPYVITGKGVPGSPGLEPATVDFELKRGVWIEGKLTDKATGQPLKASVEYFSLNGNPNLRDYPGFDGTSFMFDDRPSIATKEDGSYRIVGMPGTGLLAIRCEGHYLPPEWEKIGVKPSGEVLKHLPLAPYFVYVTNCNTFAPVEVPKGARGMKCDVALDPGWTFTGTVLGLDGKPLTGVRGYGLTGKDPSWSRVAMKTAEFTVWRFDPRRPRDVLFQHPEKGLIGFAQPPKENGGSVTVRMEPGATIVGRLVDANGKPRAGVELVLRFRPKSDPEWDRYFPGRIQTDKEGRFHIEALLPGHEFRLSDGRGRLPLGEVPRSGQTKDLGDVRIKRAKE